MSVKLAGQFKVPASERKNWSYKIKQSSLNFVFPFRTDWEWLKTKKCVRVRKSFPGEALKVIRLLTITLQPDFNFGFGSRDSKLRPRSDLVPEHGARARCPSTVPEHGARVQFLMGTNVNTPFFQVPTPEFGHGARARVRVQGLNLVLGH